VSRQHAADVAIYLPGAGRIYRGGSAGGAEHDSVNLARALAEAGFRVRHIVEGVAGQGALSSTGGVEVVTFERPPSSAIARYRAILRVLAEADARVYIQFCAGYETGVLAAWARGHGRPFVFVSMSDGDFVTDGATARSTAAGLHLRRVLAQYRIGVLLANAIVVQTETQRELARRRFRIGDARVHRSIREVAPPAVEPREAFLWVGRLIDAKDPFAYLELARRVPEARFWMVATEHSTGRALAERLRNEAASIPNLELLPARPNAELLALARRAVALVNTSWLEGFPITFLEAWAQGTPVLSLRVDPDGVIEANGLGVVAGGSIERLAGEVRSRWGTRDDASCEAARAYIRRAHDPEVVVPQWVELIRELRGG
jgi:glycosyltransferase involved in cell wall biosynthesis